MGAANVGAAFVLWPDLPHRAHRLLTYMALRSLDEKGEKGQPPRLYFGGPEALAEAIGYDTDEKRRVGLKKVAEDIARLVDAGAIERIERGRSGHRAVYLLKLDVLASTPDTGGLKDPQNGDKAPPKRGPKDPQNGGPYKDEGGIHEDERREHLLSAPSHVVTAKLAHRELDEQYDAAKKVHERAGVNASEAAMEAVRAHYPNAAVRERVILAAQRLTASGEAA